MLQPGTYITVALNLATLCSTSQSSVSSSTLSDCRCKNTVILNWGGDCCFPRLDHIFEDELNLKKLVCSLYHQIKIKAVFMRFKDKNIQKCEWKQESSLTNLLYVGLQLLLLLSELLHEMREKIQTEDERQEGFKSSVTESWTSYVKVNQQF